MAVKIPDGYELVTDDDYIAKEGDMFLSTYSRRFKLCESSVGISFRYIKDSVSEYLIRKISKPRFTTDKKYPFGY